MPLRRQNGSLLKTPSGNLAGSDGCCCFEYVTLSKCDGGDIAYALAPVSANTIDSGGECYDVGSTVTLTPAEATPLVTSGGTHDSCEECEETIDPPELVCKYVYESAYVCEDDASYWTDPVMVGVATCVECVASGWSYDRCGTIDVGGGLGTQDAVYYQSVVCGDACANAGECGAGTAPTKPDPSLIPPEAEKCCGYCCDVGECSYSEDSTISYTESVTCANVAEVEYTASGTLDYVSCATWTGDVTYTIDGTPFVLPVTVSKASGGDWSVDTITDAEWGDSDDCTGCGGVPTASQTASASCEAGSRSYTDTNDIECGPYTITNGITVNGNDGCSGAGGMP